jgi:hypothetical protein
MLPHFCVVLILPEMRKYDLRRSRWVALGRARFYEPVTLCALRIHLDDMYGRNQCQRLDIAATLLFPRSKCQGRQI